MELVLVDSGHSLGHSWIADVCASYTKLRYGNLRRGEKVCLRECE